MRIIEVIESSKKKGLDGKACWTGYKLAGTKMKGGRRVDNCVPIKKQRTLRPNKKSNKKNHKKTHYKEQTTFDPRIHHKSNAGTGYGLKRDHVQTAEETSGAQLAHILGIK